MLGQEQLAVVAKHSVAYSFAFTHPFSFYVDAYPILQSELFEQADQLTYGMQHEAVRVLQEKLHKISYYDSSIDGEYGVLTEYALKKFQSDHQIKDDGQVNKKTIQKISEEEERLYEETLTQETAFDYGQKGNEVLKLQEALKHFGYYDGPLDGIFGPKTDQGISAYKQDSGMKIMHIENEQTEMEETPETFIASLETKQEDAASTGSKPTEEMSKQITVKTSSPSGTTQQIIQTAKQYQGTPYIWGGVTPNGFDCSGYIQYVYNQYDISLPRTVHEIWNATMQVQKPSIGDLVFFETYKPGPSHAGIYLGDGKFIHAGASRGVEISTLDQEYWSKRYLGAKRISLQ
ncbi:NlpC/P60 family protein [Gracilibacillus sp. JCM 18860]|uniref:NlpC/P60 family protein n=1 Tax=Gracilibacillus sp. JCM 18860 TaxID=1306159 RepID=UPI0006D069E0